MLLEDDFKLLFLLNHKGTNEVTFYPLYGPNGEHIRIGANLQLILFIDHWDGSIKRSL